MLNNYINVNTGIGNQYVGATQVGCNGESYVFDGTYWQPLTNMNCNQTAHTNYTTGYNPFETINTMNSIYGNDLNVTNKDGKTISVAITLQRIMDLLGIIEPNHVLMDKYPSVKEAYNEYEETITKEFAKIREVARSYELIVKLVSIDHNNDDANDTQAGY
jgi:hypothetical protein